MALFFSTAALLAGAAAPSQSFLELLDATDQGNGPTHHWRLAESSGSTAAARVGAVDGTYQNTSDITYGVDPVVENADGGRSIALGAAASPGHVTFANALQGATDCTILINWQPDVVKAKHVLFTTGSSTSAGNMSIEAVDDGGGAMRWRVWRATAAGAVIWLGPAGDFDAGTAYACVVRWNGDGSVSTWVNGSARTMTLNSGTPPGAWPAVPAGTAYAGCWIDGTQDPVDGLLGDLALWDSALGSPDVISISTPQNVVWLPSALDAGEVGVDDDHTVDLAQHAHPPSGFTPAVVAPSPGLGTAQVSGEDVVYSAGSSQGSDDTFGIEITRGGLTSQTMTVMIDVVELGDELALWSLNESFGASVASDGVGSLDGSYTGNPQKGCPAIVTGEPSLGFDGWRDYVQISHDASLALANGTICGYCQVHALTTSAQAIIKKGGLAINVTDRGRLQAGMYSTTLNSANDFDIEAGEAFFFALSWGAGGLHLYLRPSGGSLSEVASDASTAGLSEETSDLYFGHKSGGDHRQRLYGFLSRVRFYDRQLSLSELSAFAAPVTADIYSSGRAYWGMGLGQFAVGSAAGNITVQDTAGFAFSAPRTGSIDKIRLNWRQAADGIGYSAGDGGTYRIELCELDSDDEPILPGQVLVNSWHPGNIQGSGYPTVDVDTPRSTIRGRRYMMTWTNIHFNPTNNYSSHNAINHGRKPHSITYDDIYEAEANVVGFTWWRGYTAPQMWEHDAAQPSVNGYRYFLGFALAFGIRYGSDDDWALSGAGYGGRRGEDIFDLYGSQRVARIRFSAPYSAQCDGVWLNPHKWGNAGDLAITLKRGSTTLETMTVPASTISPGVDENGNSAKAAWGGPIEWVFAAAVSLHTLTHGQSYTIEIRSPNSSNSSNCIVVSAIRGVAFNFNVAASLMPRETWAYAGGFGACEVSTNNGSSWGYPSVNGNSNQYNEFPVCLRFVPTSA